MIGIAQIAHPVTVVAAAHGSRRSCATGTAMYVSIEPELVAISQHRGTTFELVEASGEFSLSLLDDTQLDVAMLAGRGIQAHDKLAALGIQPVDPPPVGASAPGIAGSLATLWCRVVGRHSAGDHVIVVGEVLASRQADSDAVPLLRHRRRYRSAGGWRSDEAPEGYPL